ncbi:hypothetical protein RND81_02G024300 [Saponaria officinalis]|uniref:FBD domain-containing protein n=1 Tax=Saponaria officinalis TaxID=3572 RepID=A0AAW1MP99_SAPOF
MLTQFPLERLCVTHVGIGDLSISGASLRLKILELVRCAVDVKISASSLTSLKYIGFGLSSLHLEHVPHLLSSLHLEHVPHLSELSVGTDDFCSTILQTDFLREGYVSRLKRLEFAMSAEEVRESVNYPLEFAISLDLEELKVELHGENNPCFLWPVLLIKAAPFLRKFSAKIHYVHNKTDPTRQLHEEQLIPLRNAAKRVQHHRYLKTVELDDYNNSSPCVAELVQHLLGVSDVLEQILVSPFYCRPEHARIIKREAERIATWLPPSSEAKLIINDMGVQSRIGSFFNL